MTMLNQNMDEENRFIIFASDGLISGLISFFF